MDIEKIVEQIIAEPDGGTVDLRRRPLPTGGYWVGHGAMGLRIPSASVTPEVVRSVIEWILSLPEPPRYIGWWTDGGRLYIEPSTWCAGFNQASDLAGARKELAFYDIRMREDIRVRDDDVA